MREAETDRLNNPDNSLLNYGAINRIMRIREVQIGEVPH
jgi:hypothetical protein